MAWRLLDDHREALAASTGLLLACSPTTQPRRDVGRTPRRAAPRRLACGDGPALLAGMSTRDKLAQLLMVGVTGAADARAVVDTHHVGGILIGSWTDLSMLGDGHWPTSPRPRARCRWR